MCRTVTNRFSLQESISNLITVSGILTGDDFRLWGKIVFVSSWRFASTSELHLQSKRQQGMKKCANCDARNFSFEFILNLFCVKLSRNFTFRLDVACFISTRNVTFF